MPIRDYVTSERFTPTNFNTYSLNNGMKAMGGGNFSGANGIQLFNCFTTECDMYRIMWHQVYPDTTSGHTIRMRMISNGTTIYTGAAYYSAGMATNFNNTTILKADNAATSWDIAGCYYQPGDFRQSSGYLDIGGFTSTGRPTFTGQTMDVSNATVSNGKSWTQSGLLYTQDTWTGFQLWSPTSVLNGYVYVYGYRKP